MISFFFKPGARFLALDGVVWTLNRIRGEDFYFSGSNESKKKLKRSAAQALYGNCSWRLDASSVAGVNALRYPVTARDLDSFKAQAQDKPKKIKNVIDCVEKHQVPLTKSAISKFLPTLRKEVGNDFPLSVSSVLRWIAKWKSTGDLAALVDGRRLGARRPLFDVPTELAASAWKKIVSPRPRFSDFHRELESVIEEHNAQRPLEQQVPLVPKSTFYRHVETVLQELNIKRARRNPGNNSARRNAIGTVSVDHVLERVEIDFHKLDIIPVSTVTRKPIDRAWLIVAIDCYSRMVLGFYITVEPPSAAAVVECMRHATLPKDSTLARFEGLRSPYPAAGIPELVTTDNGTEMWAKKVEEACAKLKLRFRYCPGEMPEMKACIERFFGTLTRDAIHTAPGTTFSNPADRGDYDSNKHAAYDIERLTERIVRWIVDKYHRRIHRGIYTTPLRRWLQSPRLNEIEFPADPQHFDILACDQTERKVQHYGIEVDRCCYNNDALADVFERLGRVPSTVTVRLPEYINYIFVRDPFTHEYFKVPARKGAPDFPLPRFLHKEMSKDRSSESELRSDAKVALETDKELNKMNQTVLIEHRKRRRAAQDRAQQRDSSRILDGRPSKFDAAKRDISPRTRQGDQLEAGLDDCLPDIGSLN